MLLELNANARSIPYNIRDESHGYVGCILYPVIYATFAPLTPCIVTLHRVPLKVSVCASQYEIYLASRLREEAYRTFQNYQLIQRSLAQQVLEAVDGRYPFRLQNIVTGQVPADINFLILNVFVLYRKITPQFFF